jgi:hypothetical protein
MSVFNTIVNPALGVLGIAGAASGVPCANGAVMALQAINTACNQVAIHKVRFPRISTHSSLRHNIISVSAKLPNLLTDALRC